MNFSYFCNFLKGVVVKAIRVKIILVLWSAILVMGCNREESAIPTYFRFSPAEIVHVTGTGSTNQNIEDYWVYQGFDLIGVFDHKSTIPVIGEGKQEITIHPGIRVNGVRNDAYIYPFLAPYRTSIDLCACAQTIDIQPQFSYKPTAKFSFIEDFEGNHIFTSDLDGDAMTKIIVQTDSIFEGYHSGLLTVTKANQTNVIGTDEFYTDFAPDGRDVYIEINYKSNVPMAIGLEVNNHGLPYPVYHVGIFPSETWKKIYVNVTDLISAHRTNDGYRVLILAQHPGTNQPEVGRAYIDNIKLVHY